MAGVMVFAKLADGLTDYPYLVLVQPQQLSKMYDLPVPEFPALELLIKDKRIGVH